MSVIDRDIIIQRLAEIGPRIDAIQGWLDPHAGGVLYQTARLGTPTGLCVELGSWKGRSTAWLGFAATDRGEGARVIAVDTWAGTADEPHHADMLANYGPDQLFEEFRGNIAALGLSDVVEPWRMTTIEAARRWSLGPTIGLLHIDAGHSYADVRADFEHWAPHVAPRGVVVFDDVPAWVGPSRLVSELPRWFEFAGTAPNQWYVRKRPV